MLAESAVSNVRLAAKPKRLMKAQNDKTREVASIQCLKMVFRKVDQSGEKFRVILHKFNLLTKEQSEPRFDGFKYFKKMELLLAKMKSLPRSVNQLDEPL